MDVVGWYVLYQKCNHKDGIQNQNFGNIPVVVCHCIDNISCDDWKNPGWGMLDNEKENGTNQRAIVSLEKRKKRAQVIFSVPAEDASWQLLPARDPVLKFVVCYFLVSLP